MVVPLLMFIAGALLVVEISKSGQYNIPWEGMVSIVLILLSIYLSWKTERIKFVDLGLTYYLPNGKIATPKKYPGIWKTYDTIIEEKE